MKRSATDRLDILELVSLADDAATRRDVGAYVACFTDDAVLDGGMGEHRGKVAMERSIGPIWRAEGGWRVARRTVVPLLGTSG